MKFSLFCFLLLPFGLFAQTASISGKVEDSSHNPLEFVNVVLLNATDSSIQKVTTSDVSGTFLFDRTPAGSYFIQVVLVGYASQSGEVFNFTGDSDYEYKLVSLLPASADMKEIEVVATRPLVEVSAEKTIFNVEGTQNSNGLNAMELLRRAPGVMIDNNENIMVKGKSGIIIYIDGKRTPLDADGLSALLKSMPSSSIDRIEIITNPSAKYEAAGNAGIINIVLKKNQNFGTNGTLTLGYGVQRYSKVNGNVQLNRRTEKWNLFGNYGNFSGADWSYMNTFRKFNGLQFDQVTDNKEGHINHNYKAGADYYLSDRSTLGVQVSGNVSNTDFSSNSHTDISNLITQQVDSILDAQTINDGLRSNINYNLNYHFTDSTKKDLTIDLDYGSYTIKTDGYQPNTYVLNDDSNSSYSKNYTNNNRTNIGIAVFKADYEQPLFKGTFGTGIRLSAVSTKNSLDFYKEIASGNVIDSTRTNDFDYTENINAAYVNYNRQIKKIGIQIGLRAEQTISDGKLTAFIAQNDEQVRRSYLNIFPSAALTYNLNETNTLNLTYSRRIDRPSYQDLNPFEFRLDELSYSRGNAFLQPQYSDVVELSHTFMYAMTTSVSYTHTTGFFAEITDTTETSRSFIQPRNLGYQNNISFNINTPIPIAKWWNAYIGLYVYRVHNVATFEDNKIIDLRLTSYGGFMQQTFNITKTWGAELSGWYNGPGIWGGTFKNRPMGGMDVGMKKEIWDGNGIFRVSYGDVFRTMHWRGISEYSGIYMDASGGWESQQFRVNFTWKFGNQNIKVKERKTGSEDFNKRVE